MSVTRSAVVTEASNIEFRDFEFPKIGEDDALLKVEMVSICGSDRHHYLGGHYGVFPKILGHEMVGHIAQIGDRAAQDYGVGVGARVVVEPYIPCWRCRYCATGYYQLCPQRRIYGVNISSSEPPHLWGAYGEHMFIAPGSRVHRIAEHVSGRAATLSSVIGNGVRWVATKGNLRVGDSIVIVGPGALGLASVVTARHCGADRIIVVGLEKDEARLEFAKECGATDVVCSDTEDAVERVQHINGGDLVPLVVESSGSPSGIECALSLVAPGGKCVVSGTTGGMTPIATDRLVRSEVQLLGGLGQPWDVEAAVKIIESGRYPIDELVARVYPLSEVQKALETFIETPQDYVRIGLDPGGMS